ncbi:SgcJ/EcaC family oxidoreductase [Pareuzebyella sediminis]|uniref:SgcJ/EcaC family oxidoreductase n=1 Tax=Pareuzebyella sediminis TaxID=2607998 RepID=UPI0011EDE190|nr:SgcJ/EcaC family oxidoreductase [Pareuzebyella sediminis]
MTFTKKHLTVIGFYLFLAWTVSAQQSDNLDDTAHYALIEQYAKARETKDTLLLDKILTKDIDQLVSTGEWRRGFDTAKAGMLRSSSNNPGSRILTVEHVRYLNDRTAVVDARYEIKNTDGSIRKMWSTFINVRIDDRWKIAAIRNMLPRPSPDQ